PGGGREETARAPGRKQTRGPLQPRLPDARDGRMGLLDLEASDGEARPRIPPRASHEIPHATGDRGRARPGRRPAGKLRQGGDRDPRAALVPRGELQLARGHGIARVHRVDREPPRESGLDRKSTRLNYSQVSNSYD